MCLMDKKTFTLTIGTSLIQLQQHHNQSSTTFSKTVSFEFQFQ